MSKYIITTTSSSITPGPIVTSGTGTYTLQASGALQPHNSKDGIRERIKLLSDVDLENLRNHMLVLKVAETVFLSGIRYSEQDFALAEIEREILERNLLKE